ncbi:4'-phosphopantetheinyl transferase family protein [Crenothrix sp.]|uniref:4'-phosphopantetheinyl transferase family protein n=1 Tax=Crenothrix sp. TaxID=3100433 RepID=UPI00374CCB84
MTPTPILTDTTDITATLSSETITVWYGLIKTQDNDYRRYWKMLNANEQHYAQQLKNEQVHKRYVAVHGQLRKLLAQILQQAPAKTIISKTTHGKPYLADYPQLAFNISHSGSVFVIAIAWNCQLGIDVENYKMRPNLAGLVKKCFAPEETIYWHQLPDEQKTAEFYRFWTRKEAFVKATGFGIALGLQHCVINPEQPNAFLRIPNQCGNVTSWCVKDINLPYTETLNVYCALSANKIITIVQLNELA